MKYYSDRSPNFTPRPNMSLTLAMSDAYTRVVPMETSQARQAALYVCERASSRTDAAYLLDALGLIDRLTSLVE